MKFFVMGVSLMLSANTFAQSQRQKGVIYVNQEVQSGEFLLQEVLHTMELKPDGTVLPILCGSPNKSEKVCVSVVEGKPNTYFIQIQTKRGAMEYLPAKRVAAEGSTDAMAPVFFVAQRIYTDGRYPIAKEYKLEVRSAQ